MMLIYSHLHISQVVLILVVYVHSYYNYGDYDISELIGLATISATTLSTGNIQYLVFH